MEEEFVIPFPFSKKTKTTDYLPTFNEFSNLPLDLQREILSTAIEKNPKVKEQANCNQRIFGINKTTLNQLSRYRKDVNYDILPSYNEYFEKNVYYKKYWSITPPFLLSCKDICKKVTNCFNNNFEWHSLNKNVFLPLFKKYDTPKQYYDKVMYYIDRVNKGLYDRQDKNNTTIVPEAFARLTNIIWNCPCLLIELPISETLHEQRIWIQNNGTSYWTLLDVILKILEFYNENFTENEAISIENLLKNNPTINDMHTSKDLINYKRNTNIIFSIEHLRIMYINEDTPIFILE